MLNYYEYEHRLNEMTFDNFILDESNEETFAKFLEMSQDGKYVGRRIVVTGPSKTGKSHLTISLLDTLLRNNSNLKIKKIHGTDFAARVTWDAAEGNYDTSQKIDDVFIDELLENDVLVLCKLNDISPQLSIEGHIKTTFCRLLDLWKFTNKSLIITMYESLEWKIENDDVLLRLQKFERTAIKKHDVSLVKRWLERAISWSQVEIEKEYFDSILNESVNITHCRNLLRKFYSKNKREHFVMTRPVPSLNQILDFALGEQDGYKRVLNYKRILKSDYRRRSTVYFLQKYLHMSCEETAATLHIEPKMAETALEEYVKAMEESEQTKKAFEYMEGFMLDWEPNYYHMEGIKSAYDD